MIIRDNIEKLAVPNTRKLHGHTTVLYLDKWKNVVNRLDKDNDITAGVVDLFKTILQANLGMNRSNSVWDFFGGCFVCDSEIDTTGGIPTSLPAGVGVTAFAGQRNRPDGDTSTRRGNPNTNESFDIAGGYRFVWDWGTAEGLGDVKSVCLTHRTNGFNGMFEKAKLKGELIINGGTNLVGTDFATDTTYDYNNPFPVGQYYVCLDPANDQYYTVHHSGSGTFEINRYAYSMLKARMVRDHTLISSHTATSSLTNFVEGNASSCQLLNGYIYYTYVPNNDNKIYIAKINTGDFTDVTDITLTVPSAVFLAVNNGGYSFAYHFIHDGYIYIRGGGRYTLKIYKVNLADQTDVTELTNDIGQTPDFINSFNSMVEINGLIYLFSAHQRQSFVIDTVNETVHDCPYFFPTGDYAQCFGLINMYNNIIGITTGGQRWAALAPNFISTVNNLGSSHEAHTSDTMMKVIYEITEV